MAKVPVLKPEELSDGTRKLYDILNVESDLACVLIATSFIDETLRTLLSHFFIKSETAISILDPTKGFVNSISRRAELAYVLGLLRKTQLQDLAKIGEIRNVFAHSHLLLTFADARIVECVRQLKFANVVAEALPSQQVDQPSDEERRTDARNRFVLAVVLLANEVILGSLVVERRTDQY